jgi:adenylate cyclase
MARELRRKQRLQSAFGQYVDPRIVSSLVSDGDGAAGERTEVTVFLSDLVGFSSISELLTPDRLVELLNLYLSLAAEPIRRHNGVIDEIIGDAVQAFWGPPFSDPDAHARLACAAALEQADQLVRLRRALPDLLGFRKNLPELGLRIGLASGEAVAGTIGSDTSRSYSVMGPPVMRAEEMEGLNKRFGTDVLITADVRARIGDEFVVREVGEAPEGEAVFELMGYTADEDAGRDELVERFAAGLAAWKAGRSDAARSEFAACLAVSPGDGPSAYYMDMK